MLKTKLSHRKIWKRHQKTGKMNNKIVWTEFAISELRTIHHYYKINATTQVAEKIKSSIFEAVKNLQKQALIGQVEENLISLKKEHRYIVESNYKIIYYY